MTKKTTIERLLMTATMLEDLKEWRQEFVLPKGATGYDAKISTRYFQGSWCGTSACAAGHAALHPWFQSRGLTINYNAHDIGYKNLYGFEALSAFYGISVDAALALFGGDEYACRYYGVNLGRHKSAKDVASCIRKFVEEHLEADLRRIARLEAYRAAA